MWFAFPDYHRSKAAGVGHGEPRLAAHLSAHQPLRATRTALYSPPKSSAFPPGIGGIPDLCRGPLTADLVSTRDNRHTPTPQPAEATAPPRERFATAHKLRRCRKPYDAPYIRASIMGLIPALLPAASLTPLKSWLAMHPIGGR